MITAALTPLHASLVALSTPAFDGLGEQFTFRVDPAQSHVRYEIESSLGTCTLEPAGWVWAMDTAYTTYEVRFDDVGPDDPACDGCGAATAQGEDMGTVCIDVSPLLSWEERPWG